MSLKSIFLLEDYGDLIDQTALRSRDPSAAMAAFINMLIKLSFWLGSIGAVALIIYGGIKYTTAESFSKKSDGR